MAESDELEGSLGERTAADLSSLLVELSRALKAVRYYADGPAQRDVMDRALLAWQIEIERAGPLELWVEDQYFRATGISESVESLHLHDLLELTTERNLRSMRVSEGLCRSSFHELACWLTASETTPQTLPLLPALRSSFGHRSRPPRRLRSPSPVPTRPTEAQPPAVRVPADAGAPPAVAPAPTSTPTQGASARVPVAPKPADAPPAGDLPSLGSSLLRATHFGMPEAAEGALEGPGGSTIEAPLPSPSAQTHETTPPEPTEPTPKRPITSPITSPVASPPSRGREPGRAQRRRLAATNPVPATPPPVEAPKVVEISPRADASTRTTAPAYAGARSLLGSRAACAIRAPAYPQAAARHSRSPSRPPRIFRPPPGMPRAAERLSPDPRAVPPPTLPRHCGSRPC